MKKLILVILSLACVSALADNAAPTASPAPVVNPIYSQLKTYRNYYVIRNTKPVADYFDVWLISEDYVHCSVPVTSEADLGAATEKSWDCSSGAFGIPPQSPLPSIPADKTSLGDAVKTAILRVFPQGTNVEIVYAGRFGTVSVDEIVPTSTDTDPAQRSVTVASMNYQVDADAKSLKTYGSESYSEGGILCPTFLPDQCAVEPQLVDVKLPAAVEGTTVLGNFMGGPQDSKNPVYLKAFAKFQKALLRTVKAQRAGRYINPVEKVFANQGTDVLPEKLRQHIMYKIDVYPRLAPKPGSISGGAVAQPDVDDGLNFDINVTEAYRQPITVLAHQEKGKIDGVLTVDLRANKMSLKMSDSTGKVYNINYNIQGTWLVAGDGTPHLRVAAAGDTYARYAGGDQPQGSLGGYTFPGFGDFSQIDCYTSGFEVQYRH